MSHKILYLTLIVCAVVFFEETSAKGGVGKTSARLAAGRGRGRGGGGGGRGRHGTATHIGGGGGISGDFEDSPCIGLCFHNKQQAENEGNVGEDADYSRGWPLNSNDFGPPCVGLCHLLREMNVENPETLLEEYRYQHTGVVSNDDSDHSDDENDDYSDGHDSSKK